MSGAVLGPHLPSPYPLRRAAAPPVGAPLTSFRVRISAATTRFYSSVPPPTCKAWRSDGKLRRPISADQRVCEIWQAPCALDILHELPTIRPAPRTRQNKNTEPLQHDQIPRHLQLQRPLACQILARKDTILVDDGRKTTEFNRLSTFQMLPPYIETLRQSLPAR